MTIAVNTNTSGKGQTLGLLNGKTVAYNVCGLGTKQDCAMSGTATTNRMLLLRREALELALYTFRYIGGAQNVVVVLPPGHDTVTAGGSSGVMPVTAALAFVRGQLAPWLQLPLNRTLTQIPPEVSQLGSWSKGDEAGLVDQLGWRVVLLLAGPGPAGWVVSRWCSTSCRRSELGDVPRVALRVVHPPAARTEHTRIDLLPVPAFTHRAGTGFARYPRLPVLECSGYERQGDSAANTVAIKCTRLRSVEEVALDERGAGERPPLLRSSTNVTGCATSNT